MVVVVTTKSNLPFSSWLRIKLWPVWRVVVISVTLMFVFAASLGVRSNLERWQSAVVQIAKIAENLIYKRDVPTLERLSSILLGDYPSTYIRVCPKESVQCLSPLWVYPSQSNFLEFNTKTRKMFSQSFRLFPDLRIEVSTPIYRIIFFGLVSPLFLLTFVWVSALLLFNSVIKTISTALAREVDGLSKDLGSDVKEFSDLISTLKDASNKAQLSLIAAQVSHDIRSPLMTLMVAAEQANGLDEKSRVTIRNAVNRIKDIANNLLEQNRAKKNQTDQTSSTDTSLVSNEPRSTELVSTLIESTVSQKRLQYRDFKDLQINFNDEQAYGLFLNVQPTEFSRMISNLINNAVEAFLESGRVEIDVKKSGNKAILKIRDNGKGIPPENLDHLGKLGQSFGKKEGSGMGLHHAKSMVEGWGGKLKIVSEVGKGTEVSIELPLALEPEWFLSSINLKTEMTLVVLDDDPTIHQTWDQRFKPLVEGSQIKIIHFESAREILDWYKRTLGPDGPVLYLSDFELRGEQLTGLDVIERLGVFEQAVLVTSRADDAQIKQRCLNLKVKLLHKGLAHIVPITQNN